MNGDDTVLQTQDSKFEPSRSVAEHATSWSRRLPTILNLYEWAGKIKWNESGFRPPLCTYRLNWARRTSWGWWDDWDDTVLQTQDSKFEPWRSEAEHATFRSRRLPTILTFTRGWGRNNFVSFKPPKPGTETRTLAWKAAVLTTTLGPPPSERGRKIRFLWNLKARVGFEPAIYINRIRQTRGIDPMLVHRPRPWTNIGSMPPVCWDDLNLNPLSAKQDSNRFNLFCKQFNLFTTIHDGNFRRHSSMNVTIKRHKFSSNIYYIYVFFVIWSWKLR